MQNHIALRDIHKILAQLVSTDKPTLVVVAKRLGLSPRTLQRRIANCDTSFSALVEEVRCKHACRQLQKKQLKIYDIAKSLNYANPGSFTRAFARWMGVSPQDYRKQLNTHNLN